MVSPDAFERLGIDQIGYLTTLLPPMEDQRDIAEWHEKLAHIERQIPPLTKQHMEGTGGDGYKGITTVDGVSWSWWIMREPFQRSTKYIDTRGKITEQRDWSFLTFLTPIRTEEERAKAQEFTARYGHALRCVMIQRAYEARNTFGQRRG